MHQLDPVAHVQSRLHAECGGDVGVLDGLDIEVYHAGAGISKSQLDQIDRSPGHFYAMSLSPNRPAPRERAGQLEGQLAHCAILEPDEFDRRYIVLPEDAPRRPTEAQYRAKNPSPESVAAMEWWREFVVASGGKTVIKQEQYEVAWRQSDAVRALPDVREALSAGKTEQSAYWIDRATGVLCRCRPDFVHDCGSSGVVLLDVKTFNDASPSEFARQVARKAYHRQDAYYSDGYAQASGRPVLAFIFVAVETDYPYFASATMLDDASRNQGRLDYRRPLDTYARCLAKGEWPGYSTGIETISLPRWAMEVA